MSDIEVNMTYTGTMRITLSKDEVKTMKDIAASKGMTLTGYHDLVCREAIKKETKKQEAPAC